MEPRSLQFVATACAGEVLQGPAAALITRVCTDSRKVRPGDLFIALNGEKYDGHNFLGDAAQKGAAAAMVDRGRKPESFRGGLITVDDTRKALGYLAAQYRKDLELPIVAVGGSNGKTTTKELIASVLRQKHPTLWSEASFNNDIGVPLTLLQLDATHHAAVMEVGTNHPGELEPLVRMIQPAHGVLTCIGREHLEFFRDLDGVAREEGMLAELLPEQGIFFANGDDEWMPIIAQRSRAALVTVGLGEHNDWRALNVKLEKNGVAFDVVAPRPDFSGAYRVNLLGRHQVTNALFAIAIGAELGLDAIQIRRGLAECKPAQMRMQDFETNGVRVLDDCYNANADSMVAALQTLRELPCHGRRVAVLGEMAELGATSEASHREIGRIAAETGVGQLFAVGKMASYLADGAREAGLNRVMEFADVDAAAQAVRSFIKSGDLVLLKASRVARLERIGELLRASDATRKN
jgi:UDP-N-acetylmuramoyl-tripeptide--D-alanyl-D-alanine ligase